MEFIIKCADPPEATKSADKHLFAALYTKDELIECGVESIAEDLDEPYLGLDEFEKLRLLWRDTLYLSNLYHCNLSAFDERFWGRGIREEHFVQDARNSSPYIFENIYQHFKDGTLGEIFEPLEKRDKERETHTICRLKSKYGHIAKRPVFRIYAIKVDENCYIITGGAIKLSQKMNQRDSTAIELKKIDKVYKKLQHVGICDQPSFVEFIFE